jgi:DNA-binding MarR family transcriptional regulator
MKTDANFSLLDVFDLPNLQREIIPYLACNGPADTTVLAQATGPDPAEVHNTLDALVEKGHVHP